MFNKLILTAATTLALVACVPSKAVGFGPYPQGGNASTYVEGRFIDPITITSTNVRKSVSVTQGWQTLRYSFVSEGYYTKASNGHFGVSLNSDENYMSYISGVGLISGNTTGLSEGCPSPSSMQVEKFYNGGITLYPSTCMDTFIDEVRYDVEVKHTSSGFHYYVTDYTGYLMGEGFVSGSNYYGDSIYFFEVFGDKTKDWAIRFFDIEVE